MTYMTGNAKLIAAAGLGLLAVIYVLQKKSLLAGAVAGAVGAVADAGAGVVLGIGDVLGVPRTDPAKCAQAKADGSILNMSLYCTEREFGSSIWQMGAQSVADRGATWQNQYKEVPVTLGQTYGQKYEGPLVNDQGYDFGNLSG